MSLLSLVPLPYRMAVGATMLAASLAALTASHLWYGSERYDAGVEYQLAEQAKIDKVRSEVARRETDKRRAADEQAAKLLQKAQDAETQAEVRQRADKVIADAASGDLRRRYEQRLRAAFAAVHATAAARGAGSGDPTPAAGSAPDEDIAGMFADVHSRCVIARQRYAEIADDARRAGQLCERSYDALAASASSRPE